MSAASAMLAGLLLLASTVQISATTTTSTAFPGTASPSTATPGVAGLSLCGAPQPLRLASASSESSASTLQLRLTSPSAPSSSPRPQPCRTRVSAPASNVLRLELTPAPADLAGVAVDGARRPSTRRYDDDMVDKHRVRGLTEMLMGRYGADDDDEQEAEDVEDAVDDDLDALQEDILGEVCLLNVYVPGQAVPWKTVNLCDREAVRDSRIIHDVPHNVTLEWSPPLHQASLRAVTISVSAVRREYPTVALCSVRSVRLAGVGMEAVVALRLHDPRQPEDRVGPCSVTVAAPPRHRMSLVVVRSVDPAAASSASSTSSSASSSASSEDAAVNSSPEMHVDLPDDAVRPSCKLSVGCGSELLSVDLCDPVSSSATLNYTELVPSNVTLQWTPPPAPQRGYQLSDLIVLTALGVGRACAGSQFAPCYARPRAPPLCVPVEVACDGHYNCPMDGNDEDAVRCSPRSPFMEVPTQRGGNVVTRFTPDAKDSIFEFILNHYKNQQQHGTANRGHETNLHESTPDTLSNYGPWGYLMLGMLVCGAFLMLCGLWECCCRQPKATPSAPSHTPTTVLMPQVGATGGVLVLDSDLEDDPSRPPPYEELDQPPSYGVLFPPGLAGLAGLAALVGLAGQPKDDADSAPAPTLPPPVDGSLPDGESTPSLESSPSSTESTAAAPSLAPS